MRALILVTMLGAACTQTQARRAHRAGEVAAAGGLVGSLGFVTTAALVPAYEDSLTTAGLAFIPIAVVGALLYISTDSIVSRESPPVVSLRERRRETAWELTKQAADAARSRDCFQVQAIAPRVRELDQDFHVSVFMRDVAIQHCLRAR